MKIRVVFRSVLCGLLIALLAPAAGVRAGQVRIGRPVKIGVLVSLTGSGSSLGRNTVAALEIAADKIETETRGRNKFQLLVRDTEQIPSKALEAIKDLDSQGVQMLSARKRAPKSL